jgi:PTS system cellobiose-specific IIC component
LMISLDPVSQTFLPDTLGSRGLFTAIVVAVVTVRAQKMFADHDLVIRMPAGVPAIVRESFMSLVPLCVLVVVFWLARFGIGLDINAGVQAMFRPLIVALNTLPGILAYALIVTLLWSVGINGDNAVDVVVAPIFLQYLSANTDAVSQGSPPPFVTAYGFFTTFVNVGGTGATLALALLLCRSTDAGYRKVARLSLPTQIFQINEPIFFGLPIVLNPIFMVPYVLNALLLTAATYGLMTWGLIRRPFINVPWTTPPILGHYLVTGGDWRAAVWGAVSIVMAMAVYYPFARVATARRGTEAVADQPNPEWMAR